jgi:hypothetical protein
MKRGFKRIILAVVTVLTLYAAPCLAADDGDDTTEPDLSPEPQALRDGSGLWRDTKYFLGYQFGAIAILYVMPESVSGWSNEQKEDYSLSVWWENTTHPENDSDVFYINYILHPYWGASYFVRARERGFNNWQSFGYSTLLSTLFEFGVEAGAEEPSKQDLWVTPVIGSMVGLYFMHLRDNVRGRDAERGFRSTGDQWIWVLTDPLGSLNQQFDKWFGWDTEVELRPYRMQMDVEQIGCRCVGSPSGHALSADRFQQPRINLELRAVQRLQVDLPYFLVGNLGSLEPRQFTFVVDLQPPDTDVPNTRHGYALAIESCAEVCVYVVPGPYRITTIRDLGDLLRHVPGA